jgi:hypothetical protein
MNLDNLIVADPVERGLYVATGGKEMVPVVLDKLVRLLDAENNSPDTVPSENHPSYSAYRYWRRNSRIGQLIWIDSGNMFDPYFVTRQARKRYLDPVRVLRAIKVGRPFTAFQFQQMLDRVPKPALWAPTSVPATPDASLNKPMSGDLRNSQAVWWTPLVIISDLMGLFYDPDLSEDALVRAFREFMIRLTFLRQRAIVLALLNDHQVVPDGRHHLLPEVLKLARRVSAPSLEIPETRLVTAG